MPNKIKVAIIADGFVNWGGGIDFLKAYLLPLTKSKKYKPVVFLGEPSVYIKFCRIIKKILKSIIKGDTGADASQPMTLDDICAEFTNIGLDVVRYKYTFNKNKRIEHTLISNNIKCVFLTLNSLGVDFFVPWCLYLPDFQHKYYPEFFSEKEIIGRDIDFEKKLQNAKQVLVEANDVKKDIFKFYPQTTAHINVMPYTAIPEKAWLDVDDISLEKYKLPAKYFAISNQFWLHKNHLGAIEAFAEFVKKGYDDVALVCTGKMADYRCPGYFNKIKAKVDELELNGKVFFTGYISKLEQIKILKEAIAIIQPTLFEGNPGGGVAYNAISLGLPLLLSDIPVNKELESDFVVFFDAHDMSDLTDKMERMYNNEYDIPKYASSDCLKQGEIRQEKLLKAIEHVIEITMNNEEGKI